MVFKRKAQCYQAIILEEILGRYGRFTVLDNINRPNDRSRPPKDENQRHEEKQYISVGRYGEMVYLENPRTADEPLSFTSLCLTHNGNYVFRGYEFDEKTGRMTVFRSDQEPITIICENLKNF